METKTYSALLTDPRWQKRRLEIMQRDKFTCSKCCSKRRTLNVHHLIYRKGFMPWDYKDEELVTLCKYCHEELSRLKEKGDTTPYGKIAIYQSDRWKNGGRITFILTPGKISMKIFYEDNELFRTFNYEGSSETEIISTLFHLASKHKKVIKNNDDVFGEPWMKTKPEKGPFE